jgi:hypothetical protein
MMALTAIEKCAGKMFRAGAESLLAEAWRIAPDSAPCSEKVAFFRHPCKQVKGRTRAIRLEDVTVTSPEIWVCWTDDVLEALTPAQAQLRLEIGEVAEYEQVLAGKFTFTWKRGRCGHCNLRAMSREGELKDMRPGRKIAQDDAGGPAPWPTDIASLKREVGLT